MRSAVLQMPATRTVADRRQVLRSAVRQLERADLYLGAVAAMDLGDWQAERALRCVRADVEALRRHVLDLRRET